LLLVAQSAGTAQHAGLLEQRAEPNTGQVQPQNCPEGWGWMFLLLRSGLGQICHAQRGTHRPQQTEALIPSQT